MNRAGTTAHALDYIHEPVVQGLEQVRESLRDIVAQASPFLAQLADHALENGGKRIRPSLTLLSAGFHPNDGQRAQTMAAAVELLHIATLIHDDTVDQSDVRRGKATVSKLWGGNVAVLLGDYLFAASATFVCDTGDISVIRRFAETIMELSKGEMEEMDSRYDAEQSRDAYLSRIYDKTASLFTTATLSGARLSGAGEDVVEALREYGRSLGMAYQIVDDILDVDGSSAEFGKPVGIDLRHGVLTLPMIIARERWPQTTSIRDSFADPEDVALREAALVLIGSREVIGEAYAVAERYAAEAMDAISALPNRRCKASLEALATYVVARRS